MSVRAADPVPPAGGGTPEDPGGGGQLPGALDGLLGTGPVFRGALRGYVRLEVDNYVAWAEGELALARRENDHLLTRYSACAAELAEVRRRLAQLERERSGASGDGSAQERLVRAAEHAAALTAAAQAEARRIRDAARAEARTRLDNVARLREAAVAVREEATARVAEERQRSAVAEAAAAERIAALSAELEAVRGERDRARDSLARMREQVGCALQVITAVGPAAGAVPGADRLSVAS